MVIKTKRNIYKITYKTVTVYIRLFSMHLSGPHTDILYIHANHYGYASFIEPHTDQDSIKHKVPSTLQRQLTDMYKFCETSPWFGILVQKFRVSL